MSEGLVKCKVCGKDIATSADTCPHCGKKTDKETKEQTLGCVILIVIILLIWGGCSIRSCGKKKEKALQQEQRRIEQVQRDEQRRIEHAQGEEQRRVEREKREREEQERARLWGVWEIQNRRNAMGDPVRVITHRDQYGALRDDFFTGRIHGTATLITASIAFHQGVGLVISLNELRVIRGNRPINVGSGTIDIQVDDKDGNRHRLSGTAIDGLYIRPRGDSEARLLRILRAGGEVSIRIHAASITYVISPFDASGFDHAFRSLQRN
jgi:Sec-independent protein translocase protein TatA